jgi:Uma2 family endonuclease
MAVETAPRATVTPYRFTVDDYYRMTEAGIFDEDSRVELIEGEFIQMAAIGGDHMGCVNTLNRLFVPPLIGLAIVSIQNPVRLSHNSEPEPDVVLLRPDLPRRAKPGPSDVLLLIEVADSTLLYDRSRKVPLYARSGIREMWLVDLVGGAITQHSEPGSEGYGREVVHRRGDTIGSAALPGIRLDVAEILGEPEGGPYPARDSGSN